MNTVEEFEKRFEELQKPKDIRWELIKDGQAGYMYRTPVPGGWLVKTVDDVLHKIDECRGLESGYEWRSALCFVPDPGRQWLGPTRIENIELDELATKIVASKGENLAKRILGWLDQLDKFVNVFA